jgi:hypothetical protein
VGRRVGDASTGCCEGGEVSELMMVFWGAEGEGGEVRKQIIPPGSAALLFAALRRRFLVVCCRVLKTLFETGLAVASNAKVARMGSRKFFILV